MAATPTSGQILIFFKILKLTEKPEEPSSVRQQNCMEKITLSPS
jgi:hypothetical protein